MKAATRYPVVENTPVIQQSFGLNRKTESKINGKKAKAHGVANGRYSGNRRLLASKDMPTAGKRDSKAMLEFHMALGISFPDRNALFTACNKSSSNPII